MPHPTGFVGAKWLAHAATINAETAIEALLQTTATEPTTPAEAAALADELLPKVHLDYQTHQQWDELWDALGRERLERIVFENDPQIKEPYQRLDYLRLLARREPASLLARSDQLASQVPQLKEEFATLLARVQAKSDDAAQQAKALAWLKARSPSVLQGDENVEALLHNGEVAEALKPGNGARWVEFAAYIAGKMDERHRLRDAERWGGIAARCGLGAVENLVVEWGVAPRLKAYRGALAGYLEEGEIQNAIIALKAMDEAWPKMEAIDDPGVLVEFHPDLPSFFSLARADYAIGLSKFDPKAALELLASLPEFEHAKLYVSAARTFAAQGEKGEATKALRALFDLKFVPLDAAADAATTARSFDIRLADELADKVREMAVAGAESDSIGGISVAPYARALARERPEEVRLLIEREWAKRFPNFKPNERFGGFDGSENFVTLIEAMAMISPRRAIEMGAQLPDTRNLRGETWGRVVFRLLQSKPRA